MKDRDRIYASNTDWIHLNNLCFVFTHRSQVGFAVEDQEAQQSPPIESMLFDNDQGFFGGLCLIVDNTRMQFLDHTLYFNLTACPIICVLPNL